MFKSVILTIAIATSGLLLAACNRLAAPTTSPLPLPTSEAVVVSPSTNPKLPANYELTATQDNQTALELLATYNTVETKNYGTAGDFVTSINGLVGSNEYYWAFYLNDKYAEKGASQTILQKGDTIKFIYEAVTPSK